MGGLWSHCCLVYYLEWYFEGGYMVCVVSEMDRNGIGLDDCMGMDIMKE